MEKQIKLFLVDDHKLLRDTLRIFLEGTENIEVVGESGSGTDAVEQILCLKPDLVLMDITLPDYDGVEATAQITKALPQIKVIAVTMHPEQLYLVKFLEAGGVGYIHKSAADRDLLQAIDQVFQGAVFLSPEGVQVMAGQYRIKSSAISSDHLKEVPPDVLSYRERQVIALLSRGYSCREIGERLFLATSTVETYKRRINEKLQITKKAELVEYTIRHRLFEDM